MLLFYLRHGDPIYNPDSLTEQGKKQAEALAKRLALYGIDEIYASTSNRAKMTAQPTCDLVGKDMQLLDFANEGHAWEELTADNGHRREWLFHEPTARGWLIDADVLSRGFTWYESPVFAGYDYKKGIERIRKETDAFMLSLGYEHVPFSGYYKTVAPHDKRVALFAHQGFGLAFLSCLLDIPYPVFSMRFDLNRSCMTVIEFKEENGISIPRLMTLSNDSHLYREGLPTLYNGRVRF